MVFTSLQFLFYFLPVALLAYLVAPARLKNAVLMVASLLFYTWGGGIFVLILMVSIFVDFGVGFLVAWARRERRRGWRDLGIAISVLVNVGLLAYFKYANFLVDQINTASDWFGLPDLAWTSVALPIGISFFTFQSMSYTFDVARGHAEHLRNPVDFALYVALFPQLIAGPIVRYHEISDQIRDRETTVFGFGEGAVRFVHGLVKKVLIADSVGLIADAAFGLPSGEVTWAAAWLGTLAYTIQIYFDFSGYSDMAIGLGAMFGFRIPENFRRPYSAVSVTDFWRRWHITLSNWFRDYLYKPLGGSRAGRFATYHNLIVVFLLTGFWHGANWTFVVWGAYHGALLIAERVTGQRPVGDGAVERVALRRGAVLLAVVVGWVIFRAESLAQAGTFLRAMFFSFGGDLAPSVSAALTNRNVLVLVVALAVVFMPRDFVGGIYVTGGRGWRPALARAAVLVLGLPYAAILIAAGTFSPFLYFQF